MHFDLLTSLGRAIKKSIFILLQLVSLTVVALPAYAASACNPVIDPVDSDNTLIRILSRLADENEFSLSIPTALDRPVRLSKSMPLDRLIKQLTTEMNTVMIRNVVDGCAAAVLVKLIILPHNQDGESVSFEPVSEEATVEYIYIADMEAYVTSVVEGKEQPDLERMTPEQRVEFEAQREARMSQIEQEPSN
ncbi:MAG: hypothetical protein ACI9LO_001110 [Planctomycetota bacterium]|jgi:hypothetical protein